MVSKLSFPIHLNRVLVKSSVDNQRVVWNQKHNITIKGHPVEVYVQDINEQHTSSGLFSLQNNKWVKEPTFKKIEVDEKDVDVKTNGYIKEIKNLLDKSKKQLEIKDLDKTISYAKKLKEKIHNGRKDGLKTSSGEYSVENLVFKELRNNGYFGKLIKLIDELYDKQYVQ